MKSPRSLWVRRLCWASGSLAALATLALLCLVLVLGTSSGRARALEGLLARVNASIPGRLDVQRLDRLSPFGVTFAGVQLRDPAATPVLSASSVRVELAPLELLHGRVVLTSIELGPGEVDLRDLDVPGRGIIGALVAPGAPPAAEDTGPPYVRIDELAVTGWSVIAPRMPHPWDDLRISGLTAAAGLELDGAPEVTLRSLSADVLRADRPLLRVSRAALHLARPGQASEATLSVELGAARMNASARGLLPPSPAAETSPLAAELQLSGLGAADLRRLLDDAALESAFSGPVDLVASASGSLERLALQGRLTTAAGALDLRSELRGRRALDLAVSGRDLDLSLLRPDLPASPLAFELESSIDGSTPGDLPIELRLRGAKLGAHVLPVLDARARWNGARLDDLRVELTKGRSLLRAEGSVDPKGAFDLGVTAALRPEELEGWAVAAGLPRPPRGMLGAELRFARSLDGVLALRGTARSRSLRLPEVSIDAATLDVDVTGRPLELRGRATASVLGLSRGRWRAPRLALTLEGSPAGYRVRGSGVVDRVRASIDFWARPDGDRLVLRGRASGAHGAQPFELTVEPTTLHRQGWLSTRGIALRAGGQALELTGEYGRPRSELVLRAPALDLAALGELGGLGTDWRGRGQLTLRARGRPEAPVLDAAIEASELSRAGARPVRARVALSLDAEAGRADVSAEVSSGSGPRWLAATFVLGSEFRGGAGWHERWLEARHRAVLDLKHLDVAGIGPWLGRSLPGTAELSLSATLDGTLAQPVLHATLAASLRDAFGISPLRSEQRLDYSAGKLSYALGVDDAVGRWLSATAEMELPAAVARNLIESSARWGEIVDDARFRLELDAARRRVGGLWTEAPATVAGLEVDGGLRLTHDAGAEPTGEASLRVSEAAALTSQGACTHAGVVLRLEAALARQRLAATLTARHRDTELLRVESSASVELGPALRGDGATLGAVSAALTSRALELEHVPYLCQRLRGRLDASLRLADLLGNEPSLTGDVTATGLSMGAEPRLDVRLLARADHDDADATLTIDAPQGRSLLRAQVPVRWSAGRFTLAADAPLSASARLDALPIAPLLDPAGALSYASGTVNGNVEVTGTLSAPEPSGRLELVDAELTATALAQPLHGVRGRLTFNHQALWIEHFEARDRDGVLKLSGKLERQGTAALALTLDMRAKDFPLRQRGQVVATTSGHAKIDASLDGSRSRVSIRLADADTWLEKAQIRSGIDLRPHPDFVVVGASRSRAAVAGPAVAGAERSGTTESHIRLDATDHFWIKREDFAIQLSTRLDAVIIGDRTKITGRVDIHRGYLDLMGRVFDVDRNSRLDFTGTSTPDPVVAIVATYEHRASGKTVKVQIGGRGSKPTLAFYIDDAEVSAGEALEVLVGRRSSGNEDWAKRDAASFVSGLTAGLLATSARRELGAAAPILMIEPGEQTGEGRIRAGFELDTLVPRALRRLITGVYVEGIVEREGSSTDGGQSQQSSTQAGVLVELYFPHQLFSTGQWGPGTTWSLDWGWQL